MSAVFPKVTFKNIAIIVGIGAVLFFLLYAVVPITTPPVNLAVILGFGLALLVGIWAYYRKPDLNPEDTPEKPTTKRV